MRKQISDWCSPTQIRWISLVILAGLNGCGKSSTTIAAATQPKLAAEYANLLRRAEKENVKHPEMLNAWGMNCEHCLFVDDEDAPLLAKQDSDTTNLLLQAEVIAFVRRPGALDYIFNALLSGNLNDAEVLADPQILVYAGEYYGEVNGKERRDEILPPNTRAVEILEAAQKGRFNSAEKRWPEAPIREKIENAARRAIESNHATTKPN